MRVRRKRKSERKRDLREKYKREELKKKRVIHDELKDKGRKSRRATPDSTTSNSGSQTGSSSALYIGGEGSRDKYRIGREYYRIENRYQSEKLDKIRAKKNKIKAKEEIKRASQRRKKRFRRFTRPVRRVEKALVKSGDNLLKQGIHAPDKATRMMQDDFDAMGVAEKGMVYLLKKVAGIFAKAVAFLFQSALNGFVTIFGPFIPLFIVVAYFMIYIMVWSPFHVYFDAYLWGAEAADEGEYADIYTYVESRLRYRTVSLMQEEKEKNPDAELTSDDLTDEAVYDAVVVTYAIASSKETEVMVVPWANTEEGTESIDNLAKDMVYVKKGKIKYRSLEEIKKMKAYEELLEDIEIYEYIIKGG